MLVPLHNINTYFVCTFVYIYIALILHFQKYQVLIDSSFSCPFTLTCKESDDETKQKATVKLSHFFTFTVPG